MANVVLFHHVQGLTHGLEAIAESLRRQGHEVFLPDLFDGLTFGTVAAGLEHLQSVGIEQIVDRSVVYAAELPRDLVYVGFSLGCLAAQKLGQTRAGARGVALMHGGIPTSNFGAPWPDGLPLLLVRSRDDAEDPLSMVEDLAAGIPSSELVVYPGDRHLFTDPTVPDFEPDDGPDAIEHLRGWIGKL